MNIIIIRRIIACVYNGMAFMNHDTSATFQLSVKTCFRFFHLPIKITQTTSPLSIFHFKITFVSSIFKNDIQINLEFKSDVLYFN